MNVVFLVGFFIGASASFFYFIPKKSSVKLKNNKKESLYTLKEILESIQKKTSS